MMSGPCGNAPSELSGPSWVRLVRTRVATNTVEDRRDATRAREQCLTCAFVVLGLAFAVRADVDTTRLPAEISAQIQPRQPANPQVSALQDH